MIRRKICVSLGCDFDDIIELNYDYDPADTVDDGTQNYKPWSEEEENILIEEYQNMVSLDEIAKKLNRSAGAIGSRIGRLVFAGKMTKRKEKNAPKTEGEAKTPQQIEEKARIERAEKNYGYRPDPDTMVVGGD